jgi:glutathione synthase
MAGPDNGLTTDGGVMENRYLIVADPLEQLNPVFDLGVLVSGELLRRGIAVDYLDQSRHDATLDTDTYLSGLPVREIRSKDAQRPDFWELGPEVRRPADDYTVVLQRKDPPVDAGFKAHAEHWIRAPEAIVQINRPPATYELSEHTVALRYPEYATPTWTCSSFEELVAAVRAQDREAVCKPKNTYCGIGVTFIHPAAPEEELRSFWEAWAPEVIVQPYLEAIEESGDLRILTIDQEVLGSVLRVPAEGSRLANLHQGATAARLEPTPRQLECCRVVAEDLNPLGLHLLGLDFIGEHLNEVNFTSPTTLTQINQVNGIQGERALIDQTERMWRARR